MEKKTLKCQHCQKMNFPMVEFCHHCGESLHTRQVPENQSVVEKWLYHAIDGMFWLVDESVRWWEIGKLAIQLKALRRKRASLLSHFESLDKNGGETSLEQKQSLLGVTEELARLSTRDEFLRTRCWALTPEILFAILFVLFIYGLVAFRPAENIIPFRRTKTGMFSGQVVQVKDIPVSGHSTVARTVWHKGKLYIGGDGGLISVNPETGEATATVGLPEDFYVRDLLTDKNRLIIGGFAGIYELENTILKEIYSKEMLPSSLINGLAVTGKKQLLIGTIGDGMMRGDESSLVFVPGTSGKTVRDFGRLDSELWIMHEDGLLIGRNDDYRTLNLQVLAGRHLRRMVMNEKSVFIGSDQGVIAGYRNARNWVWTLLSAGKPGFVNDLLIAGEVLFIASDEGLFRFYKGRMERLSAIPCQSLSAENSVLAAVNPDSIMLFYFSPSASSKSGRQLRSVPEVGSYTPSLPVISMVPMPDLQMGRLPDFRALEQNRKPNTEVASATLEDSLPESPETAFPAELQSPVFSSLRRLGSRYYLATRNRGLWWFEDGNWHHVSHVPDVGVDSLADGKDGTLYAYGDGRGIFRVDVATVSMVLEAEKTVGLLDLFVSEKDLLMLYKNGEIRQKAANGSLSLFANIPGEFKGEFHSLWKSGNNIIVVVDRGVLLQESDKQWNLVFFKGRIEGSRVTSATADYEKNVYIGINDGRVFKFSEGKLEFVATINDQPVAMNYAGCLWVAGDESLYFLEKNNLVPTPFHAREKILGAFPVTDSRSIIVFTGSGIRFIAGR